LYNKDRIKNMTIIAQCNTCHTFTTKTVSGKCKGCETVAKAHRDSYLKRLRAKFNKAPVV